MKKYNKALMLLPPGLGPTHCNSDFMPVCSVCDFGPGTRIHRYPVDFSSCDTVAVNISRFAGGIPITWASRAIENAYGAKTILLYGGNINFARQLSCSMRDTLIPQNLQANTPFSIAASRINNNCVFLTPAFYILRVIGRKRDTKSLTAQETYDLINGKFSKIFYSESELSYYINLMSSSGVRFLFFDTYETIIKKAAVLLSKGVIPVVSYGDIRALTRSPLHGLSS